MIRVPKPFKCSEGMNVALYDCTTSASRNICLICMRSKSIDDNKSHFDELMEVGTLVVGGKVVVSLSYWLGVSSDDNRNVI